VGFSPHVEGTELGLHAAAKNTIGDGSNQGAVAESFYIELKKE